MEFRVLGPIELSEGGRPIDLGPRMHRAVLALLLMQANRVVSVDHLVDQLWGAEPPSTAGTTLRGYVAGLRRALEPHRAPRTPPRVLVTQPPGYLLRVPLDSYDAARFESGVAEGKALLAAGQPEAARSALQRALGLWRGPALGEFAFEDFAQSEAARLEQLRLLAREASLEAELDLGRHDTAVVELERLTDAQRLRERLWALLMIALYRSGRQADALRAFAQARRILGEELGLEPGPELRLLEGRILAHDPSLDWRPPTSETIATPLRPSRPPSERLHSPSVPPVTSELDSGRAGPPVAETGPRLVGRESELAILRNALERLDERRGRSLVIVGEPGIGKTTLLAELAAEAQERRYLICSGRGDEFERDVPFAMFIDALDAVLGSIREETGLPHQLAAELARIFPSLGPSLAQTPALPQERYRLHRAVSAVMSDLATRRPLVMLLDDLHWADAASLELVSHLLRHPPRAPVLLSLATRPGHASARLVSAFATAARAGVAERIDLGPLSPQDVNELVGSRVDRATREQLWRESGGNPFYLEQLLRVDRGGPGRRTSKDSQTVPVVVAASIGEEVTAVSDSARAAVWAASVVGDDFDPELIAGTAPLALDEALTALDELIGAGLIVPTGIPRSFRFRHPIVRRAVYESAGAGWRLGAHARAAEALAARGAPIAARAHHAEQAAGPGDNDAVALLTQAGHSATARAPATAARWFEAALRLVPANDVPRRLELLMPMATSLGSAGQLQESREALLAALELMPTEQTALRAGLVAFCAAVEHLLGRHDDARARLREALASIDDVASPEGVALMIELAAGANYSTDFSEQELWSERAVVAARALGIPALSAASASMLAYARFCVGRTAEGRRAQQEASALLDVLTDAELAQRLDAPFYLGFAECFLERYKDSLRHFERGIAVARASGQGQFVIPTMAGQTFTLTLQGRLDDATELIEATVDAARLSGVGELLFWGSFTRSWVAAMAGDLDTALVAGEETMDLAAAREPSVITAAAGWTVGSGVLEAGQADRCVELILTMTGGPDLPMLSPAHRCMAMEMLTCAELARGRMAEAKRWAERAQAIAAPLELAVPAAQGGRAQAAVLLAAGETAAAAEIALEVARRAEEPGARLEAARSRLLAGRALGGSGQTERAIAELTRADAELTACGARRYREEAAAELRRLWHHSGWDGAGVAPEADADSVEAPPT